MKRIRTTAGKEAYRWDYQELRYLVHVLTKAKDFQETLNLFLDLHTHKEMSEIIRRAIIASMLIDRKTWDDICQATGASPSTISKIQQKLLREKTILPEILHRSGDFESFMERSKTPDAAQRRIDRFLTRATLGIYDPRSKRP